VRADRLLSIILTMQARGQVTVGDLAEELEVSERTVRRDLDALMAAGVPVYAQRGRGGGWALLGGHKLNLSGLTPDEAQALTLFVSHGALGALAELGELGLEDTVRSALQKLLAVLPGPVRQQALDAHGAIHHDPSAWGGMPRPDPEPLDHLPALRHAVLSGRQVDLGYHRPGSEDATVRRLHPLGLVRKRNAWYLLALAPSGPRTYRVSRVTEVTVTEEAVEKPEGFDLGKMWGEVSSGYSKRFGATSVHFRIRPGAETDVARWMSSWVPITPPAGDDGEADGRSHEASFPNERVAAMELARLGDRIEVVSPDSVRDELARLGHELAALYGAP
jgi:predicted DNA-binding transcriptional regulator YafY